jgi:hypothetical protein
VAAPRVRALRFGSSTCRACCVGVRRNAGADTILPVDADQPRQREAARSRLDLRHRGAWRPSDAASRRRRRPVRLHPDPQAVCDRRRHRRPEMGVRLRHPRERTESRSDVLGGRRRSARLCRRRQLRLRARRRDGKAVRYLRHRWPHRLARESRTRSADPGREADDARSHLQGSDDPRRPGWRGSADLTRRRARVRRANGRLAMGLPHHSASRRSRVLHVAGEGVGVRRRREQLAGHGAGRGAGHRLCPDGVGRERLLWSRPDRRRSVCELPHRAGRRDGDARLAFPDCPPRHLGPGSPIASHAGHHPARRADDRRRGAGHQARVSLCFRSRHRRASVSHRIQGIPWQQRAR